MTGSFKIKLAGLTGQWTKGPWAKYDPRKIKAPVKPTKPTKMETVEFKPTTEDPPSYPRELWSPKMVNKTNGRREHYQQRKGEDFFSTYEPTIMDSFGGHTSIVDQAKAYGGTAVGLLGAAGAIAAATRRRDDNDD